MINVIKEQATGITHVAQDESVPDDGHILAYYDDVTCTWQCVRDFPPVRVKLKNGRHHYKSCAVVRQGCELLITRPNKDETVLVPGERVLAYQDNERAWHTWPRQ